MDEVKKLLTLISYLKQNPSTKYSDLAELLGESEKEVREDISKLLMCGVPPYYPTDYICVFDEGDSVSIDFVDHFRRPVKLSPSENVALQMALDEYQNLNPNSDKTVSKLREKLASAATVPAEIDNDDQSNPKKQRQTINNRITKIKSALQEHKKIEIDYFHPGTRNFTTRILHPYLLLRIKNSIYVKGYCELRDDIRSLKIDRIKSIEILDDKFTPPGGQFLDKLAKKPINYIPPRVRSQLKNVKVQFSQQIAPYIVEEWGKKFCTPQKDGSVIFETPVLDDSWTSRFIFSFGSDAAILTPQDIVEKVKSIAANIESKSL